MVTGNTGFKGAWLTVWLLNLGADVVGISKDIPTNPSLFETLELRDRISYYEEDIRDLDRMTEIIQDSRPDFVFHLAAQPIVSQSYKDPVETLSTNILGTTNILEALRVSNHPCSAVIITSDKCYDNQEWTWGYRESDRLGGKDPYSASKGGAELVIKTYVQSYFNSDDSQIKLVSTRAGNVIGGGDWAVDRIVPDTMRAWSENQSVVIRNPHATRPWQHVLEPLGGYLRAGQALAEGFTVDGESFNFGPNSNQNFTVAQLLNELRPYWGESDIPVYQATGEQTFAECNLLKLCCDKALHKLQWEPTLEFNHTAKLTAVWYRNFYDQKDDMWDVTTQQIMEYQEAAADKGNEWTNS